MRVWIPLNTCHALAPLKSRSLCYTAIFENLIFFMNNVDSVEKISLNSKCLTLFKYFLKLTK